jgi:hypothetical protein
MMMFDKMGSSFASHLFFYLAKEGSEVKTVAVFVHVHKSEFQKIKL